MLVWIFSVAKIRDFCELDIELGGENHPVSRSGCHPSFRRRGARNHPVSGSRCHPSFGRRGARSIRLGDKFFGLNEHQISKRIQRLDLRKLVVAQLFREIGRDREIVARGSRVREHGEALSGLKRK